MPARSTDLLTLGGISIIAYIIANVVHEGLGHWGACMLVGGIPKELTTAYFDWDASHVSETAVRLVAAGGTIANLLAAFIFGVAFRSMRSTPPAVRFFLWLSMSVNYFVAAGYPLFSGVSGIGDWVEVVKGYEPLAGWRIGLALIGAVTYFGGVLVSLRMLNPLLGSNASGRVQRAIRLTAYPYVIGCVASTFGTVFNPIGIGLLFTSAAAHFGGTSVLAWMAQLLKGPRIPEHSGEPLVIERSMAWIVAAAVLLVLHAAVLGPGVRL